MTLSSKDIEGNDYKQVKESWFARFFLLIVRLARKVPYLRKKINESEGGLSGAIFRCQADGDHFQATRIAIFALEKFRNKKCRLVPGMEHHTWWSFMRHATESAGQTDDDMLKEKLIALAENGIEPFQGIFVAKSFLEFSRWRYRAEIYDKAIEYAKIAADADYTWAEPDFLLGWYGLVLSTGNAETYLSQAIEKDERILFRVLNNDICKQYPSIIKRLKEGYSSS